jgi:hypothetical protein
MVPVPLLVLSFVVMDFLLDVATASSPSESGRFEPSLTTVVGSREMVGNFWEGKSRREERAAQQIEAVPMQVKIQKERRA